MVRSSPLRSTQHFRLLPRPPLLTSDSTDRGDGRTSRWGIRNAQSLAIVIRRALAKSGYGGGEEESEDSENEVSFPTYIRRTPPFLIRPTPRQPANRLQVPVSSRKRILLSRPSNPSARNHAHRWCRWSNWKGIRIAATPNGVTTLPPHCTPRIRPALFGVMARNILNSPSPDLY